MNKKNTLILIILAIFCFAVIGSVSANENASDMISTEQNIDEELQTNYIGELESAQSDSEYLTSADDEKLNQASETDLI